MEARGRRKDSCPCPSTHPYHPNTQELFWKRGQHELADY